MKLILCIAAAILFALDALPTFPKYFGYTPAAFCCLTIALTVI